TKEEDDVVMAGLDKVHQRLIARQKFGPAVRLMPTTAATTLRKDRDPPLVLDGPYAETKEQLLGFYLLDCATFDEALECAKKLARERESGALEIRPLRHFVPGKTLA
ncbi:MAG TPA: YciI family protein, partial [Myxococcota bacterium]|nr:YciI family protein [Myxococcota bacterium]